YWTTATRSTLPRQPSSARRRKDGTSTCAWASGGSPVPDRLCRRPSGGREARAGGLRWQVSAGLRAQRCAVVLHAGEGPGAGAGQPGAPGRRVPRPQPAEEVGGGLPRLDLVQGRVVNRGVPDHRADSPGEDGQARRGGATTGAVRSDGAGGRR